MNTEFVHYGESGELYHYADCGLDNIWLNGGVERRETPYGPATTILNIDELHAAIATSIANSGRMNGKEFRFIRVELDLSQKTLADLLQATEQQVHRWETGKVAEIPRTVQVALAGYYLESQQNGTFKALLDKIADLDATLLDLEKRVFTVSNDEWVYDQTA